MGGALNYHHLEYFWEVARDGHLTRTAQRLRVSQSALSAQIRQLEAQLGQDLFLREGRRLALSEAGRVAFTYADGIFRSGQELLATVHGGRGATDVLHIGAVATLSRNLQESFLRPLLAEPGVRLRLLSGSMDELLTDLDQHRLDLILTNRPIDGRSDRPWRAQRIAHQPVSVVGRPRTAPFRYPDDLADAPILLPSTNSPIRTGFDAVCGQLGLAPRVVAEVDDMAMLRLLARDVDALALLPSVVVRDELERGELVEYAIIPDLYETFTAITLQRRFEHPLVARLLARTEEEILAMRTVVPPRGR
jgi:LysR family transcriptional regulator, transcriptional activator of nhaA